MALRQTALHAPAAYMASLGASSDLARTLDAEFSTDTPHMARALTAYNNLVPEPQRLSADAALAAKQRDLSAAVDHAGYETRLSTTCLEDQATLRSECEPGARALWQAVPNRALGLAMEPAEFVDGTGAHTTYAFSCTGGFRARPGRHMLSPQIV